MQDKVKQKKVVTRPPTNVPGRQQAKQGLPNYPHASRLGSRRLRHITLWAAAEMVHAVCEWHSHARISRHDEHWSTVAKTHQILERLPVIRSGQTLFGCTVTRLPGMIGHSPTLEPLAGSSGTSLQVFGWLFPPHL
jgi:hypothetical protein